MSVKSGEARPARLTPVGPAVGGVCILAIFFSFVGSEDGAEPLKGSSSDAGAVPAVSTGAVLKAAAPITAVTVPAGRNRIDGARQDRSCTR